MTDIVLSIPDFRKACPVFANSTTYPDSTVTLFFDEATCFCSTANAGRLQGNSRALVLYWLTAHMMFLSGNAVAGDQTGGVTISASEGSVSTSLMQPLVENGLDYWLNQSIYGQQIKALLQVKKGMGFYVTRRC